ncbi:GPI mannosyltransferase 2 [Sphaerosporella brunnea]|uniref:GPI mannosyltransferase 2 n=1 Tax=Sphaerosporella brunnea TaxID=1250544 RepID=A0A5J5F261_9PEZI|nr:GPI mannosyltransferase 2 [Sphaerosporella brunnea]
MIQRRPYLTLFSVFSCWKLLLAAIALVTPSPAYDTSTSLALLPDSSSSSIGVSLVGALCNRLTRWDAIYFTKAAQRGYMNEQEWAFGWGYTQAIAATRRGMAGELTPPYPEIISAILLSNACHFASVVVLYKLTLLSSNSRRAKKTAWLASAFHILSPAGLFLSAPYSESLFSFLSFTGSYLYQWSSVATRSGQHLSGNAVTLCSAIVFSVACTVRSNGLLNGLIFLLDFTSEVNNLTKELTLRRLIRVFILGVGGLVLGAGVVLPQYIAWKEYCTEGSLRPWCTKLVPSIYSYVQDFYWNVGLFRYWTLSNLPLFLLAAPTIFVLLESGVWGIQQRELITDVNTEMVSRLAIAQLLLTGMALVGYHVQIITRMSSGCAVWYWWVAAITMDEAVSKYGASSRSGGMPGSAWVLRWMVMYGLIQGVLYAGFLPPA